MRKRSAIVAAAVGALALLGAQSAAADTINVTNTNDSGAGSLRAAINQANQLAGTDQIVIEATGTIPLQSGLPTLTGATEIQGPGASDLSLDGSAVSYVVLDVSPGSGQLVTVRGVSIDHAPNLGVLVDRGTLDVIDSTLSGNDTAIENYNNKLHVIDSTLSGNDTAIVGYGSGPGENTGVLRSTLHGNRIAIKNDGPPLYVSQSTLMDNTFGIMNQAATVVINRSTLASGDVSVSSLGGTIPHGKVKITQSTLMSGDNAHAIIVDAGDLMTLRSTIIANDTTSPFFNCSGQVHSLGFNLADDGSCGLGRESDQPNTEPLLRPLGNYGGPTKTFALSTASPAIDAGRVAGTAQTDQRGQPRKVDYPGVPTATGGDNSDIGAFELQSP